MNYIDKRHVLIFCLIFICFSYSCTKKNFNIVVGQPEENPAVVLIDTLTPLVQVEVIDSFITGSSPYLLTGFHDDQYFGRIFAKPFFRLTIPSSGVFETPSNSTFDSLRLIMVTNHNYYGDTLQPVHYEIFRLTENLDLTDKTSFYNTTDFMREPNPVGTYDGRIYPNKTDTLRISLSDIWGREIFEKILKRSLEMTSAEEFNKYLKGLVIENDTNTSKNIMGFYASEGNLTMRLYYHINEAIPELKSIDFPFKNPSAEFNHIRINRLNKPLNLKTGTKYSSEVLSHLAYLQPLSGVRAYISFPTLNTILQQARFVSIVNAELKIKPVKESYLNYRLPPRMMLTVLDQYSEKKGQIIDAIGKNIQYGNLNIDDLFSQNTSYQYDLTAYLKNELTASQYEKTSLIFEPPDGSLTRFDKLVFGDKQYSDNVLQFKLHVLMYK